MEKRGLKGTDEVRHEHEVRSRISRNRGTLPLRRSLIINSYLGPLPFSPILYCRQTTPGIVFASLDYSVGEVFRSSSSVSLQISFLCRLIKLVWHISNYRHLILTRANLLPLSKSGAMGFATFPWLLVRFTDVSRRFVVRFLSSLDYSTFESMSADFTHSLPNIFKLSSLLVFRESFAKFKR